MFTHYALHARTTMERAHVSTVRGVIVASRLALYTRLVVSW